ncbi:chloride channel protein [Aquabacterium sp.]|uniref:chloride channel protein n=1 Tax=Aquabacterium sp. TaxID=1872578 RepID=UPI0035AE0AA1
MDQQQGASQFPVEEIKSELSDWRRWAARAVVMSFAVLAGLGVVLMTWLSEHALSLFFVITAYSPWLALAWTPAVTAAIVWLTRKYFVGASGSGIPQVLAALDTSTPPQGRHHFISLRLSLAKLVLTVGGLLAGLSTGREGPSVQVGAGIMHHARKWLPARSSVGDHGLIVAGGAAGIAAAFNTPLGGVMFAIEELSRRPEHRSSGILIAGIVLSGLMAISIYGNGSYFGHIQVASVSLAELLPGLAIALSTGVLGGLFSKLMIESTRGGKDIFSRWRASYPIRFAAGCGFVIALIGIISQGATFGSGYTATKQLLDGQDPTGGFYVTLRFLATWLSQWSGVPGGVFAPSLAIGAGIGNDISQWTHHANSPALIALGMAGFLAAATQAPITAFIIVMEMVEGHSLVLSLMACAMVASAVSRLISPPMYGVMAELQLARVKGLSRSPTD